MNLEVETVASFEKLKIGDIITRAEISDRYGGTAQSYLPHTGGKIVCGCFKPELNPKAPEEILSGHGVRIVRNARRLVEQNTPVPVFLKRSINRWEFVGYFRAKRFSEEPGEIVPRAKAANREGEVAGVLYLEEAEGS